MCRAARLALTEKHTSSVSQTSDVPVQIAAAATTTVYCVAWANGNIVFLSEPPRVAIVHAFLPSNIESAAPSEQC